MSKKTQIENMLIAINAIKYNLECMKKFKIFKVKNKYAMKHIYDSILFHIKIINKIIQTVFEMKYGK